MSDGGAPLAIELIPRWNLWASRVMRPMLSTLEQTRALRRRYLMEELLSGKKRGALWTIKTDTKRYTAESGFQVADEWGEKLAAIRTRLSKFAREEQCRLVNWGYIQSDLAVRSYFRGDLEQPETLPFPEYELSTYPAG